MVAYLEMILLNLLPLVEYLDLDFGFAFFSLGVMLIWFFYVPFHYDVALLILPCVFFPFMSFLNDWFKVLAMQGLREMVDAKEVLDRKHLGRLSDAYLGTHLTL